MEGVMGKRDKKKGERQGRLVILYHMKEGGRKEDG